jgi:hypothetical protein
MMRPFAAAPGEFPLAPATGRADDPKEKMQRFYSISIH